MPSFVFLSLLILPLLSSATVLFSTKTAYSAIENLDVTVTKPKGCREIQLNLLFRHGTRYPSANDVRDFNQMLEMYNRVMQFSKGMDPQVDLEHKMTNPYRREDDKLLSKVGENELYNIAKRFATRFPGVFKEDYSPNFYKFSSSCKSRSLLSGASFGLGAFESRGSLGECGAQPVSISMNPCHEDPILRFYDLCSKYLDEVADNKTALSGFKEFLRGAEVTDVSSKVNKRLGLPKGYTINTEMMREMYVLCAFSVALHGKTSKQGWCSVFDESDFDVMEYSLDLKSYLKRGAKYPITYESSCPLLRDILLSLKAKVAELESQSSSVYPSYAGVYRFAHAETLIPLYALMNVSVDKEPLGPYNYKDMKNRKFKAAVLSPMGGNVGFVLYACSSESKINDYKIQMYINEKLVKIPCCDSAVDCPFENFEKCYQCIVDKCNFDKVCDML